MFGLARHANICSTDWSKWCWILFFVAFSVLESWKNPTHLNIHSCDVTSASQGGGGVDGQSITPTGCYNLASFPMASLNFAKFRYNPAVVKSCLTLSHHGGEVALFKMLSVLWNRCRDISVFVHFCLLWVSLDLVRTGTQRAWLSAAGKISKTPFSINNLLWSFIFLFPETLSVHSVLIYGSSFRASFPYWWSVRFLV